MKGTLKHKPNIEVVSNIESLANLSLKIFVDEANKAINANGVFHVAISGGHTPEIFFEQLGEKPEAVNLPWDKIHLFWVDERYVPQDSEWSNYKMAADTFLKKVSIPRENVHHIPTDNTDLKVAAKRYEETLRDVFGLKEHQLPKFDLIMLGMGKEGHTGSLFPNSYASFDKEDLACVVYVMDDKRARITLTHPILCAAAHLVVMVSGAEKAEILKIVLSSEPDEVQYPIHALWPILDKVTWVVDEDAAKQL